MEMRGGLRYVVACAELSSGQCGGRTLCVMVIWLLIRKVNYVGYVDKQTTESLCISLGVTLYRAYGAGVPLLLCAATESEGVSVSAQRSTPWLLYG